MKEHIFSKNGIYYRVNDFDAARQTIIFIHGLSGNSSAWEPYEKEFMTSHNLLCVDLRGHGCSMKYPKEKDYKIERFIEDIETLLNHLNIKNCIVANHSFGSIISVGLIQRNPNLVKKVIFLAPTFKQRNSISTRISRYISGAIALFLRLFPVSRIPGKRINYPQFIPTKDWDFRRIRADISNTNIAVYFFCLHSLYCSINDEFFGQLNLPTLIIHGKKDTYISIKYSMNASQKIAGSKIVILPNADHMLIFNYSKEISKIMVEFLSTLS